MNKQNRSRLIDTENRLTVASGEWGRCWVKKVKGSRRRDWELPRHHERVRCGTVP